MNGVVPPAGPPRPFAPPPFGGRTAGRLQLRAARWGDRPVVSAAVLLPAAGSTAEAPGEEGASDLVADLLVGGTRRRSALAVAEALDDLGMAIDVTPGFDATILRLSTVAEALRPAMDLLAELLTEPSFPEDELERCRERQIDALAEQRSEPDFLARERLALELFPDHPYGRISPTVESLRTLRRDDLLAFHARAYSLPGALVALAGDLPAEELLGAAADTFGPRVLADGATPSPSARPGPSRDGLRVEIVDRPGSAQAALLFGRRTIARSDPRYLAATVANQSLGGGAASRLFHVLREERGLTYGAFSGLVARRLGGHFSASIDCRPEVTRQAATGLLEILAEFAAAGPAGEEHERSCRYLDGTFVLARETPGALVHDEVIRALYGLPADEWSSFRQRLGRIGTVDARDAARDLLAPTSGTLVAVGEARTLLRELEGLGPVTVRDLAGEPVGGGR